MTSKFIKKSGKNVNKNVQCYLNSIEGWLKKWRLLMAPLKCNFIVFSTDKRYDYDNEIDTKLFGTKIWEHLIDNDSNIVAAAAGCQSANSLVESH